MFMANVNKIKYVSGNDILNGSITNNNVALGVDMDLEFGPTINTGYYEGINPTNSGYTIYYLNGEDQPRIWVAHTDQQLIDLSKLSGGPNTTVINAINWFKDMPGYFVTNKRVDSITTSGMTMLYDPGLVQSYPKGGDVMDNLGSLAAGYEDPQMYLTNNGSPVDYVNEKGGTLRYYNTNDGDGSYCTTSDTNYLTDFTYNVWFKVNSFTSPLGWNTIITRDGGNHNLGVYNNGDGFGYLEFYDDYSGMELYFESDSTKILPNRWYNATVKHIENVKTQLFLDGILIAEDTNAVDNILYNTNTSSFSIGGGSGGPDYFDGLIGHLAVYNRALTDFEIEKNHKAVHSRYYGTGETMMLLSGMPGQSSNFGYVIMDPATGTVSGPFDTGINHYDYYENDIYVVNHGGYVIFFVNNNDGSYKVQFIDSFGSIVDTMDFSNNNYDYYTGDGYIVVVTDYHNGIIKYFDGVSVGEYSWDPNLEYAYYDWNYDPTTKDKSIVIFTVDTNTNIITWKLANAQGGIVNLISYNNNDYQTRPVLYTNGNFVIVPIYNNNTGEQSSLNIYGTDGTLKHSQDLTGLGLQYWNHESFGTGKMSMVYETNSVNDDYQIYAYVESTNTFISTTHVRGNNYHNYNTYSQYFDYPGRSTDSENITYMFYGDSNQNNQLYYFYYLDYLTLFEGDTTFTLNVLANNQEKGIGYFGDSTKYYIDLVDTGDDGKLKAMTITKTGFTFTDILPDVTTYSYSWGNDTLNNDAVFYMFINSDFNSPHIYVIDHTTGGLRDTLTYTQSSTYSIHRTNSFDSLYIRDSDGTQGWYMCRSQRTFASVGSYDYQWTSNRHYVNENTFTEPPFIVLFNPYGNLACRIISQNGISNEFTLPSAYNNSWDLNIGNTFITWRYQNGSNTPAMMLYDFNGNILNDFTSISQDQNWNFWTYGVVGNIACVVSGEGFTNGTLNATILNTNGTSSYKTLSYGNAGGNYWLPADDYYWWYC